MLLFHKMKWGRWQKSWGREVGWQWGRTKKANKKKIFSFFRIEWMAPNNYWIINNLKNFVFSSFSAFCLTSFQLTSAHLTSYIISYFFKWYFFKFFWLGLRFHWLWVFLYGILMASARQVRDLVSVWCADRRLHFVARLWPLLMLRWFYHTMSERSLAEQWLLNNWR